MGILDFLFPKYCVSCRKIGSYVCPDCFAKLAFSQKSLCFICGKYAADELTHPACQKESALDGCFIALAYTPVAKKLIYTCKYKPYVRSVSEVMGELLYEGIIQKEALMAVLSSEKKRLFVPIPLHTKKLRSRGYNHAALLGKELAKKLNVSCQEVLIQDKETIKNVGVSKEERKKQMHDVFSVKNKQMIQDTVVFLVDDLVTTGVTFMEAATVVKKAGAKSIYGIAFAGGN